LKYFFVLILIINQQTNKQPRKETKKMFNMKQQMSIMIPRIFPQWVDEAAIARIFCTQGIGMVSKVRIIHTSNTYKNGMKIPIYKAIVYFEYWFNTQIAYNFQQRLIKKKQARVVYDDPWFWVVFENTKKKQSKKKQSKKDSRVMRRGRVEKEYTEEYTTEENDTEDDTEEQKFSVPFWEEPKQSLFGRDWILELFDSFTKQTKQNAVEFVSENEESILNEAQKTAEQSVEQVLNENENEESVLNETQKTAEQSVEQVLTENENEGDYIPPYMCCQSTHMPMPMYYMAPHPMPPYYMVPYYISYSPLYPVVYNNQYIF
jgi:hypothetical protein